MGDADVQVSANDGGVIIDVGNGFKFCYPANIPAPFTWARTRCERGLHEPTMSKLLVNFMRTRPKSTFFDVGALYGYFSLLAFAVSGGQACIYAFEMNPRNFPDLERVILSNTARADNSKEFGVNLRHVAIGDVDAPQRRTTFKGWVLEPADGVGHEALIDFSTLDSFSSQQGLTVDLVKIDVEGFEGKVVAGGVKTLLRDRSVIMMELHGNRLLARSGQTRSELLHKLIQLGFRAYLFGHQREDAMSTAVELSPERINSDRAKIERAGEELIVLSSEDIRTYWPYLEVRH